MSRARLVPVSESPVATVKFYSQALAGGESEGPWTLCPGGLMPSKKFRVLALLSLCMWLVLPGGVIAQIPDPVAAAQVPMPGVGHQYIGLGAETVNPADGSLSFDLPLQPPPGRQLSFPFGIHYNASERFTPTSSGASPSIPWELYPSPPFQINGWSYQLPAYTAQIYQTTSIGQQQQTLYCDHTQNYVFRGFDGVQRSLALGATYPDPNNNAPPSNCNATPNMGSTLHGYSASTPNPYSGWPNQPPLTVADASGTTYQFPSAYEPASSGTASPWGMLAQTITDRNGNQITLSGTNLSGKYLDTLGRQVVSWSSIGSSSGDQLTIAGLGGNIVVKWAQVTEHFPESGHDVADNGHSCVMNPNITSPQNISAVSEIDFPNGQKYSFSYDPTYARPSKIVFPGGGYIRYVWALNSSSASAYEQWTLSAGATASCYLVYDTAAITDRYVSYDGSTEVLHQHFVYTTNWEASTPYVWSTKTATVTSADMLTGQGTVTAYTYGSSLNVSGANDSSLTGNQIPIEQQIVYQDCLPSCGSGHTLKTAHKTWLNSFAILGDQTILDNGQGTATENCYDGNEQVINFYEYGFQGEGAKPADPSCYTTAFQSGSGAYGDPGLTYSAIGPLKRQTTVAYHNFLGSSSPPPTYRERA